MDQAFAGRGDQPLLVPFITAGDPGLEQTVKVMHALVAGGAGMIELGMPFSDPMADGPVIQAASERALARGANLEYVLDCVREFRSSDTQTPVILMGYLNPLERMGHEAFTHAAAEAGVDGLLIVDLPPEEAPAVTSHSGPLGLKQIFLVAPTTADERLSRIAASADGFIYYVSLKGITGAGNLDVGQVADQVGRIRGVSSLPVAVGFGVKQAEDVAALGAVADAVVVGSALVEYLHLAGADGAEEAAKTFVANLKPATIVADPGPVTEVTAGDPS
ncbi:MAG: tryptophan synthase subunit alpha [Pseudomonadota bacterium]